MRLLVLNSLLVVTVIGSVDPAEGNGELLFPELQIFSEFKIEKLYPEVLRAMLILEYSMQRCELPFSSATKECIV